LKTATCRPLGRAASCRGPRQLAAHQAPIATIHHQLLFGYLFATKAQRVSPQL
jgi:hypothetical protein